MLEIGEKVKDFETWYQWWHTKANFYEHKKLFEIAMAYHRASLFYLSFTDERKLVAYQAFRRCFERHYQNDGFEYFNVPYEYGKLPAIYIPKKESKKTLLIMSGFDSFAEELVSWFYPIKDQLDANIILFDGPGQGSTPFQKLYFTSDYEKVVSTVLDYFEVDEADGIGVSWGGYFILRAAAFEKRLKRCICFDIFYSGLDALKLQITPSEYDFLKQSLQLEQKELIDKIITTRAKQDLSLKWILQHGTDITGENSPYDLIKNISKHSIAPYLQDVNQDCLLLAGSKDMFVPKERLLDIENELVNARSVTSSLFDEKTGGSLHCQVDDPSVALKENVSFLQNE